MPDQSDLIGRARERFLNSFRWLDGHADIDGLFRDPELVDLIGAALAAPFEGSGVTVVAGIEAIGFIPAVLVANAMDVGVVLVRKQARRGGAKITEVTSPDWRGREVPLLVHSDHLGKRDRVLIVDDWVETASHVAAAWNLIEACGALVVGVSALVDDVEDDEVRRRLRISGLLRSFELPPATQLPVSS